MPAMKTLFRTALVAAGLCALQCGPAGAASMKECSAKYKAAKADGSLGGESWKQFRSTQCATVKGTAATPATSAATVTAPAPAAPAPAASSTTSAGSTATAGRAGRSAAATPDAAAGPASFPSAVNPKYSSETPGKARMHSCLDQYKANKAAGSGNGGMRWLQKGGGYYSLCAKKLKG